MLSAADTQGLTLREWWVWRGSQANIVTINYNPFWRALGTELIVERFWAPIWENLNILLVVCGGLQSFCSLRTELLASSTNLKPVNHTESYETCQPISCKVIQEWLVVSLSMIIASIRRTEGSKIMKLLFSFLISDITWGYIIFYLLWMICFVGYYKFETRFH